MSATVAHIYRHPVKSLGEEALDTVALESGRHVPWDRVWALVHRASGFDPARAEWKSSRDFVIQSLVPELARIRCAFEEASGLLRLDHPARPPLTVRPGSDDGAAALSDWIVPLIGERLDGPFRLTRLPGQPLTDFPNTHLLICSTASLAALEEMAGQRLEHIRFRANLWLDGLDAWQEFALNDREIAIGEVRLRVIERCTRCNATAASPATGERDVPVPALLRRGLGHMDFGVYAQVAEGGRIATGDPVRL